MRRPSSIGFAFRPRPPPHEKDPPSLPCTSGPEWTVRPLGTAVSFTAKPVPAAVGPFIWIPPSDWHFKSLQAGDYLLYPACSLWLRFLPPPIVGLARPVGHPKRTETRFIVVLLCCSRRLLSRSTGHLNLSIASATSSAGAHRLHLDRPDSADTDQWRGGTARTGRPRPGRVPDTYLHAGCWQDLVRVRRSGRGPGVSRDLARSMIELGSVQPRPGVEVAPAAAISRIRDAPAQRRQPDRRVLRG